MNPALSPQANFKWAGLRDGSFSRALNCHLT